MGLFDGLNIMAPISAGLSYYGQHEANINNKQMAQAQMEFQREMDSTKYQRAVVDLQKAGLNPMMAYGNIAASSPSGALGHAAQNELGSAVEAFNRARGTSADVDLKKEQEETAKATTDATQASADKLRQDTLTGKAIEQNTIADTSKKLQDARTGSAQEALARAQTAAVMDQRARDSATAPIYNVLEKGTQYIKDKINDISSASHGIRFGRKLDESPRNITIFGTPAK